MTKRTKEKYHEEYLRRKTRGRHPKEEERYGKTLPKRSGVGKVKKLKKKIATSPAYQSQAQKGKKSILDATKEKWNLYSYVDIFFLYFSLNTRDITKAQSVDEIAFFDLHILFRKFFERLFDEEIKKKYAAEIDKINVEYDMQRQLPGRHRYLEITYIDMQEEKTIYFLQYWRGRIRKSRMPKKFWRTKVFLNFLKKVKKMKVWE